MRIMQGIRGISRELEQVVNRLPFQDWGRVVDAALDLTLDEFGHDVDIRGAVKAYRADPAAARLLADSLTRLSEFCDDFYIKYEDLEMLEESKDRYTKMTLLNGLAPLLAARSLTPEIVDDLVYYVGAAAADTGLFAERMIEKLR